MKRLKCGKVQGLILLYVYGELDEGTSESLRLHTVSCPECACKLKEMQTLLRKIPIFGEFEPSSGITDRINAECAHALARPNSVRIPRKFIVRPVLAIFAFMVIFFSLILIENSKRDHHVHFAADYEYEIIDRQLSEAENSLHALDMDVSFLMDNFF